MKSILVASLLLAGAAVVLADQKADLQKQYNGISAAVKKKDLKASMAYLTSDYVDIDIKGKKHSRKEFEALIKQQFQLPLKMSTFDIKVTKVTPKGADLVVENSSKLIFSITDPNTKKTHKLEQNSTSRDVWVKSKEKWLLKSSTTLTQKRTIDGKEIPNG